MRYKDYNIQEIYDFLKQKYPFTYEEVDLVFKTKSTELKDFNLKLSYVIDLEDVDTMICLYDKYKTPFYRIAQFYGSTEYKIRARCTKLINSRGKQTGVNSYNTFFKEINSPEKAYFLGLWYADGSLVISRKTKTISLTLTKSDEYLIEDFLKRSNIKTKIYTTHKEDKNPRVQINISSKNLFEDLEKLGCVQNKSHQEHLKIPKIREDLISHFIRGFFDGDGISYKNQRIGFCGHYDILYFIYNQINKILKTPTRIHITFNRFNNIYYMTYSKKEEVKQIVSYIYQGLENQPFLKRKYENYRPLLQ